MALRDFNIYNGDLALKDGRIDTDDEFSVDNTITDRLKTLIYKVLVYHDVLKDEFLGKRITDLFAMESEIKKFCYDKLYLNYPLEDLAFLINIECLIIDNTANLYFYYLDSNSKVVLLTNYEMTL